MKHDRQLEGRAFSLIEILVSLAVLATLATIAFSVIGKAVRRAEITESVSNLRQIGAVLSIYTIDNAGVYPKGWDSEAGKSFIETLWPYAYPSGNPNNTGFPGTAPGKLRGSIFYTSLVENDTAARTFGMNALLELQFPNGEYMVYVENPPLVSLVGDTKTMGHFRNDQINFRNDGYANVLFLDGHVEAVAPEAVPVRTNTWFWRGISR